VASVVVRVIDRREKALSLYSPVFPWWVSAKRSGSILKRRNGLNLNIGVWDAKRLINFGYKSLYVYRRPFFQALLAITSPLAGMVCNENIISTF